MEKETSSIDKVRVIGWILLLFAFTVLGALPFIIGGLNFHGLSSTTRLSPMAYTGLALIAFSPALTAILVTGSFSGRVGVRSLLRQVRTWRIGIAWYGVALIGPMILALFANILPIFLSGMPPQHRLVFSPIPGFGAGNLFFMIFGMPIGALGEELGWRGFAQLNWQKRYGALAASIFVGIIWSTWHIWYVITPDGFSNVTITDALATYIRLISTSIIYAWMYNSTKGSLFLVTIAHAGHNIAVTLIRSPGRFPDTNHLMLALSYFAAAVAVVLMTDTRTLSGNSPH